MNEEHKSITKKFNSHKSIILKWLNYNESVVIFNLEFAKPFYYNNDITTMHKHDLKKCNEDNIMKILFINNIIWTVLI